MEAVITLNGDAAVSVAMQARFDEFHLDVILTYAGVPLVRAQAMPAIDDLLADKSCAEMSMYMIQRYSDRCVIESAGENNILRLHFVH